MTFGLNPTFCFIKEHLILDLFSIQNMVYEKCVPAAVSLATYTTCVKTLSFIWLRLFTSPFLQPTGVKFCTLEEKANFLAYTASR